MTIAPGELATAQDVNAALALRLLAGMNLSDVPNKALARSNLGLGGMATQNPASVAITGGALDGVTIGGTTPGYGDFATLIVSGTFDAPATGEFWSDDGARVLRMNDRLLVGGAVDNDAAKPNVEKDWLSEYINWPVFNATAAITSNFGTIALTVGSQTAQLDPVAAGSTQTTIGVAAFALSNNPGTYPGDYFASYGFYGEGRLYPGSVSDAFAAEFEAVNLSNVANGQPTPYRELRVGSVQALRLGSGGGQGLSPSPALSAIGIVPNGSTFNAGIVFDKAALTGADGTTGFGTAIAMAKGHLLSWYCDSAPDGAVAATITSTIATPANAVSLQAQDGGWTFIQPSGAIGFSVQTVASAANYLSARPAAVASSPALVAAGSATNVPIDLVPKGASGITLGSNLANYILATGAAASSGPTITVAGSDTNAVLALSGKGVAPVWSTRGHFGSAAPSSSPSDTFRRLGVTSSGSIAINQSLVRVGGNFSGSSLSASFVGGMALFGIDSDTVTFSNTNAGYTAIYNGQTLASGWSGGRTLSVDFLNIGGAGNVGSSAFHVAGSSEIRASAWMGGTPGAERGSPFSRNEIAIINAGAGPHLRQLFGDEWDLQVADGARVLWKGGGKVVQLTTDVRRGLQQDFAYSAGMQADGRAPGFDTIYAVGGVEGWFPGTETSAVMRGIQGGIVDGPANAVAFGVDFSNMDRIRVAAFMAPGFKVDGGGNLGAEIASGGSLQTSGGVLAKTAVVSSIQVVNAGLYSGTVTLSMAGGATATVAAFGIGASFSMTTPGTGYAADDTFEVTGGTTTTAATGTAEIAGDTLTVTVASTGLFGVGQTISNMTGVTAGTRIIALGTGTGGIGTYTVSESQTVSSTAITTTGPAVFTGTIADNVLTVSAMTSGIITNNTFLIHDEITDRTRIIAFGTGTGGIGTYTIDTSQVRSSAMTGIRAGGPAEGKIARVNSGAVSGFRMTNPGYYTALPSSPVSTRVTSGAGVDLTFVPAVNLLAVNVTAGGSGYGEFLPPVVSASCTLGAYAEATFKVSMTATQGLLSLNTGGHVAIPTTHTPASASAPGTTGTISWDADYIYVATATNTWRRAQLLTW